MAYRILHIADVHLDMAFVGVDASLGTRRREQLREAFERALQLARERQVDALCIAGDLYEDGRAGPDRAAYLARVFGALAPIRVFVSPGNHDPHTASSLYRQVAMPDNVHVFGRRRFTPVILADGIMLWGFGHERDIDRDPALAGFSCEGSGTHLLLFHGSDRDRMPPGKESIAPFGSAEIERAGAQHAMVGHFHGQLRGGRYAYPGSLEPHNFAQEGRHTAALVTVEDGSPSVEFIDMSRVRYLDVAFDLSEYGDRVALADALRDILSSHTLDSADTYCRVRLQGEAQPSLDLDPSELETQLSERYPGIAIVDEFAAFDYEAVLRAGKTVRAEFVRTMRQKIADASESERPLYERALRYGMLAFAGRSIPS